MALKKPTEYFRKQNTVISVNEDINQELEKPAVKESNFSDTVETYKVFSETLDNYRIGIEKVNYISEKVEIVP